MAKRAHGGNGINGTRRLSVSAAGTGPLWPESMWSEGGAIDFWCVDKN